MGCFGSKVEGVNFLGPLPDPCWPSPKPYTSATKRKASIFNNSNFKKVDQTAKSTPTDKLHGSFEEVALYITREATSFPNPEEAELAKVRALFYWVVTVPTDGATVIRSTDSVLYYMQAIEGKTGNKPLLFAFLCRAIGIPCVVISGITKSVAYQIGSKQEKQGMQSQWNSVFVGGQWRLLDLLWASAEVSEPEVGEWTAVITPEEEPDPEEKQQANINEFYFLTDPELLICTHLPKKACWQLLERPVSKKQFLSSVYIRERFFDLGMKMIPESRTKGKVKSEGGHAEVVLPFGINQTHESDHMSFIYQLQRKPNTKEGQAAAPLENYILQEDMKGKLAFRIRLPMKGKCKLDVYGRNMKTQLEHDVVCSYLLDCKLPNKQPYPDCPLIGWGPGIFCEKAGLVPLSHVESVISTENGQVEIKFKVNKALFLQTELLSNDVEETILKHHHRSYLEDQTFHIEARLPQPGEYSLKLFAIEESKQGSLYNVCNYLIRWDNCTGICENSRLPRLHSGALGKNNVGSELEDIILPSQSILVSSEHFIEIDFDVPELTELYCELTNSEMEKNQLGKFVENIISDNKVTFKCNVFQAGEYGVNVFARTDTGSDQIHHVYSSLLKSTRKPNRKGSLAIKNERTLHKIIIASQSKLTIPLPNTSKPMLVNLRKKLSCADLSDIDVEVDKAGKKNKCVVTFAAEDSGFYLLDAFVLEERNAVLTLVKSFQIWKCEEDEGDAVNPRVARLQLKLAIKTKDPTMLEEAIERMKDIGYDPQSDWEVKWAIRLHQSLGVLEALKKAVKARDLVQLKSAVQAATGAEGLEQAGLRAHVDQLLVKARDLLKWLQNVANDSQKAANVNQTMMAAELKSYTRPHETVVRMLQALYYLLGEEKESIQEWEKIQALLNQRGEKSIKVRIKDFDLQDVKLDLEVVVEAAVRAHLCLVDLTMDRVKNVSKMAVPYFNWAKSMIEEIKRRSEGSEDADLGLWEETIARVIHEDQLLHRSSSQASRSSSLVDKYSLNNPYQNYIADSETEEAISTIDV